MNSILWLSVADIVPGIEAAQKLQSGQITIIWLLVLAVLGLGGMGTYILRHHAEGMREWRRERAEATKDRERYSEALAGVTRETQIILKEIARERLDADRASIEARVRNTSALELNNEVLSALVSKLATGMMMTPENLAKVNGLAKPGGA